VTNLNKNKLKMNHLIILMRLKQTIYCNSFSLLPLPLSLSFPLSLSQISAAHTLLPAQITKIKK